MRDLPQGGQGLCAFPEHGGEEGRVVSAPMPAKRVLGYAAALLCVFVALFYSTLLGLVRAWSGNENYNHGFLIVPISLYLAWARRVDILNREPRPSRLAIPVLLVWAGLFIIGVGAEISTFERISVVVFLLGCTLTLAGREITRMLMFPILFLAFMIPIPAEIYSGITNPLAILATTCSVSILRLASVPVCQEGNLIVLPNSSMEVMDVCSGLRTLISIIALALLMCHRLFSSALERSFLLLLSIPVSIAGNIARITIAGLFSYEFSSRMSFASSHTIAGISAFLFSMVLLLGAGGTARWVERKKMQYTSSCLR
jgi:exosortase